MELSAARIIRALNGPRALAPACLAAALLCAAAAALPAAVTDVPRLHVVVVLDKEGKDRYEIVRGTYIPEAVLVRSPYYKPPPKAPPPEPYRPSLMRFFFSAPDPDPEPEPEPLPEAPAYAAPAAEPAPQAAPAAALPVAAKLARTVGKERGRRMIFNLLAGGATLLAALALLRYYLNRD